MKRRQFLQKSGVAGAGMLMFTRMNPPETYTVEIFQTDKLTEKLRSSAEFGNPHKGLEIATDVENIYNSMFNLDFNFVQNTTEVPQSILEQETGYIDTVEMLSQWGSYATSRFDGDTKILLVDPENSDRKIDGSAFPGVLPSCCSPGEPAIVMMDFAEENTKRIQRCIAHEVGHTVGLHHCYGCNLNEADTSIMMTNKYARQYGHNIFGETVTRGTMEVLNFNSKISDSYLIV
jgi:hypothetical protein